MREIKPTDIIGARIVDIHKTYEVTDGLVIEMFYFTVDRGFTFLMPCAGDIWTATELPSNATRLEDEVVIKQFSMETGWFGRLRLKELPSTKDDFIKRIKQRTISGVYCVLFDDSSDFDRPGQGVLVFDDGSQAWNNMIGPDGPDDTGLYFSQDGAGHSFPLDQLVDFFTIPPECTDGNPS